MEKIIEILSEIRSDVDFSKEQHIITDKILSSIEVVELITELEDAYGIEIDEDLMENSNFDSADAIWKMVQNLQGN